MTDRSFSTSSRGVGRNTLDVPLAALAALAVAFLTFNIPGDQLAWLVGTTGLPTVMEAAAPPLGMKARIGIGCVAAVAIFALVFALLRLLDRKPRNRADVYELQQAVDEAPRLRRRDFHPDAPARRPISAARDLGEPDDEAAGETDEALWLSPAQPDDISAPVTADCEQAAEPEPGKPCGDESIEFEPAASESAEEFELQVAPAASPTAAEQRPAASITELMTRLELGLSRRQGPNPASALSPDVPVQPAKQDLGDDRLQSAIDSLQRLAARQG